MSDTLSQLVELLRDKFNAEGDLSADTKLSESGLDSLDTINFLFSLEEVTGVEVPDEALTEEPLETLGQLAAYVDAKKS